MTERQLGGYNGRALRVNLTSRQVSVRDLEPGFCRKYLGGAGFIAYHLLDEMEPGIDPLGPDNKLIFSTGPLSGLSGGGFSRHTVGAKSPLSGGFAKSEVGQAWAPQLKRAGFDIVIVEGRSAEPVYLWIHDGEVEIRDASGLWGTLTRQTQDLIRAEVDDQRASVAMIGRGGEHLVRFACIMHGPFDAAGRGGLGAVMGSKNLKAVAVRGSRMPAMTDRQGLKDLNAWLKDNMILTRDLSYAGTGLRMPEMEAIGALPTHNFRGGSFPGVDNLKAETIRSSISVGMDGCYACPVRCKKAVAIRDGTHEVDSAYGGPEYEVIAAIGSCCGVSDLAAVAEGSQMCNAHGLDGISTGVTIAFAMECFEQGLLTRDDTGGMPLEFGSAEAMLWVIEQIVDRKGIGNLLAEGSGRAAASIGNGAEHLAMQVKNVEIPMHEPRLSKALGLGYMVNPHGADHMTNLIDVFYAGYGAMGDVTIAEATRAGHGPVPLRDIGPRKVAMFKMMQSFRMLADCLVYCQLLPYTLRQLADLTSAATGWDTSPLEQLRVAERVLTMGRLFNLREGLTDAEDRLPNRFFGPTEGGALVDTTLDPEEMENAKRLYYRMMGWGEKGVPTGETLEELGISELA